MAGRRGRGGVCTSDWVQPLPLLARPAVVMQWIGVGTVQGLDEVVIATIMRYVLLGLEYVHKNNGIHRDVKVRAWAASANIT